MAYNPYAAGANMPQMPMPQIPQPNGWAGKMSGMAGNNQNMLLQLGMGLLDKRQNNAMPFSAIGQQAMAGRQMDQETQNRNMTKEWLMRNRGLSEQDAQAAVASPVVLAELLKPAKTYDFFSAGDTAYAGNQATGEATAIDGGQGGEMFSGRGLDAQALNQLVENGTLTSQQALEVAAGKSITGPNGETFWANPQALAGANGGVLGGEQGGADNGMRQLTGPRMTEDMRKAGGFATRAQAADKIISETDITAAGQNLTSNLSAGIPLIGNYMVPKEFQLFDQAQRDFINAMLRRESGAVISPVEFDNGRKQYFPQPGDGPEVLAQKKANRRNSIEALNQSASPAPTFGEPDRVRKWNPQTGRIE